MSRASLKTIVILSLLLFLHGCGTLCPFGTECGNPNKAPGTGLASGDGSDDNVLDEEPFGSNLVENTFSPGTKTVINNTFAYQLSAPDNWTTDLNNPDTFVIGNDLAASSLSQLTLFGQIVTQPITDLLNYAQENHPEQTWGLFYADNIDGVYAQQASSTTERQLFTVYITQNSVLLTIEIIRNTIQDGDEAINFMMNTLQFNVD